MRFTIGGYSYDISRTMIIDAVKGQRPAVRDARHKYYTEIEGIRFPIKQVVRLTIGNPYFHAQDARRILTKLEFGIGEFAPPPPGRAPVAAAIPEVFNSEPDDGMHRKRFAVTIAKDEDGFYVASCPALSGCHSQGSSRSEALTNIREAIRGYLASMQKHGETVPDADWEVLEVAM